MSVISTGGYKRARTHRTSLTLVDPHGELRARGSELFSSATLTPARDTPQLLRDPQVPESFPHGSIENFQAQDI